MPQPQVTVYVKPACVQCTATYRWLDKNGIEYEVLDISTDPAALEQVKALGYLNSPVVIYPEDHWSGFRPDKIDTMAAEFNLLRCQEVVEEARQALAKAEKALTDANQALGAAADAVILDRKRRSREVA